MCFIAVGSFAGLGNEWAMIGSIRLRLAILI